MRAAWSLLALAVLGLSSLMPNGTRRLRAEGQRARSDVMPLSQVRPKMKGYGLTVFEGTKPERFDIEVIDVLKRFMPKQDLILIKAHHPRLDVAKVVAGMSGSPIFIDGKMIGAYAYGWTFAREPVAGVTPIENMLSEIDRPLPRAIYGWPLVARGAVKSQSGSSTTRADAGQLSRDARSDGSDVNRFAGTPEHYELTAHAAQLEREHSGSVNAQTFRQVSTPLLLGGFSPLGTQIAEKLLGPLGFDPYQAGGAGDDTPTSTAPVRKPRMNARRDTRGEAAREVLPGYEDGSAIGVQLVRGDTSAMGLGTVTRVEGDRLVAFGHPMTQAGITALPTAVGRVLWFLASEQRSFKIGMPVRPMGALIADRQSSIVVSQSAQAPVIPVRLEIEGLEGLAPGAAPNVWNFEVAHEKFMTPTFLSMAIASAIQATTAEKRDVSWTLDSEVAIEGKTTITIEDFGVAIGGMPTADDIVGMNVVEAVGAVLNNPWQPVFVKQVRAKLKLRFAREIYRLRGAELLDTEIDAGKEAHIRLRLVPYDGPAEQRILTVPIPSTRAGETVNLEIVPGYTENHEMAPAETLDELIRNLDEPVYLPKSLVVKFSNPGNTLAFRGRVAAQLPPGAVDLLSPTNTLIAPAAFAATPRSVHPLPFYVLGRERVSIAIRPVMR
ncbi:MAG TPA: SpoIVB peptidase S55 domain-containing protein [Polyangiaceae bacterium]